MTAYNIPQAITLGDNITELILEAQPLDGWPVEVFALKNLRILRIRHGGLKSVPADIGKLKNLDELDLSHNAITKLPAGIGKLDRLSVLHVSHNRLSSLPAALSRCLTLRELDISGNCFSRCPQVVLSAPWLARLRMAGNQLQKLPATLGDCTQLQELDLSQNALTTLPAAIGKLVKLRKLDLSHNNLRRLPAALSKLPWLEEIDVSDNPTLPQPIALLALPALKRLRGLTTPEKTDMLHELVDNCNRYKLPPAWRKLLWQWREGATAVDWLTLPAADLSKLLNLSWPELTVAIRAYLYELRPAQLAPGAVITPLGECLIRYHDIEARLQQQGIQWREKADKTTTHLLLGAAPIQLPVLKNRPYIFIGERELLKWLDRIEGRYLALDPPAEKLDMLRRLLMNGQRQQVLLAIQMIKGGGMPEEILPVLISVSNSCDDILIRDKLSQMTIPYMAENEKHTKPSPILSNVGKE
ncbi:MAG: leucine-rich repeat domain-containing protein [Saprospiraceae bacterium]|nr:leucine-rich repeat domain-containing protein [Saprospiraceae bacterium]